MSRLHRARFFYVRTYLPTNNRQYDSIVCDGPVEFMDKLASWNSNLPDTWAYEQDFRPSEPIPPDHWDDYERPWLGAGLLRRLKPLTR